MNFHVAIKHLNIVVSDSFYFLFAKRLFCWCHGKKATI